MGGVVVSLLRCKIRFTPFLRRSSLYPFLSVVLDVKNTTRKTLVTSRFIDFWMWQEKTTVTGGWHWDSQYHTVLLVFVC